MNIQEIAVQSMIGQGRTLHLPDGAPAALLLLLHAPAQIELGSACMNAETEDALLLRAKTPLRITPEDTLLYDWVLFDAGADQSYVNALQLPENVLLRLSDSRFLAVLLEQLCVEFYAANTRRSDMIDFLLKALLIRLSETGTAVQTQSAGTGSDPHYAALVRLREKIYANPQERWTVEMMCSEVSMSRSYFQLIYRETFGMTCIADVINCKMSRARELLTSTSYTIAHIAQLCGYDNEEHFMRQFKKNNGVTPTVYRREHRE